MKFSRSRNLLLLLSALGGAAALHAAGQAHVHGVARLDVAVDTDRISFRLATPLDNLVGFERAPRTAAERKLADAALLRLRQAASMFRIDPAAGCVLSQVDLSSAALSLGAAVPQAAGHAEVDGSFEFACRDAAAAAHVDIGLFAFDRLQRIQVQVAAAAGQFSRNLSRPATRIQLKR